MVNFSNLKKDIIFLKSSSNVKNKTKNVWENRSKVFFNSIIDKKNKINFNFFSNFRSHKKKFISENPGKPLNNFFLRKIYSHQFYYIKFIYYKLKKNDRKILKYLKYFKLDKIGNPGYCIIDGLKVNERFIRHCHFFSLFTKVYNSKKIKFVTDIGGGYGSFARLIHKKYKNLKIIIIDLPEQLITAKYYLENNFPSSKIANIRDIYKIKKINETFLAKYNVILVPHSQYDKIKINLKKNLIINFNSFGEIDKKSFEKYMGSKLLKNSRYLFSVNRLDSFPTYKNNISFLNYNFDKYSYLHRKISPVWDFYFIKKFYLFTTKKMFSSRCLEFIGENKIYK